jgi:hypothetical protein
MLLTFLALSATLSCASNDALDLEYVGPDGADGWAVRFRLTRAPRKGGDLRRGYTLRGVTTSGKQTLTLDATFGPGNVLRTSRVALANDGREKIASVTVDDGRARVTREGHEPQAFDVPAGVIVTSAPDWTDIALLCERYDRTKGGKQTFAALWIHPVQPAQLLQLTIERKGRMNIRDGKLELTTFLIHLRNQSPYRAWATGDGMLVRLAPLNAKGVRAGLFRKGLERDAGWKAAE